MERLLIAADDLTGALYTAIPFAHRGFRVEVFKTAPENLTSAAEVAAVNCESRHAHPETARLTVEKLFTEGKNPGFSVFIWQGAASLNSFRTAVDCALKLIPPERVK